MIPSGLAQTITEECRVGKIGFHEFLEAAKSNVRANSLEWSCVFETFAFGYVEQPWQEFQVPVPLLWLVYWDRNHLTVGPP